jgi:hypothetical protein
MKKLVIVSILAFLLLFGGYLIFNASNNNQEPIFISSFEECIEAGYPTLDSYPEQCETSDGLRFVKKLPENEIEGVISTITAIGTLVCLPHWDTSGPQTMECAFGFLDGLGNYYALRDPDPLHSNISLFSISSTVEITGVLIPGSDEKYQSLGTIEIEDIRVLD